MDRRFLLRPRDGRTEDTKHQQTTSNPLMTRCACTLAGATEITLTLGQRAFILDGLNRGHLKSTGLVYREIKPVSLWGIDVATPGDSRRRCAPRGTRLT
jgi:hypothetical protein